MRKSVEKYLKQFRIEYRDKFFGIFVTKDNKKNFIDNSVLEGGEWQNYETGKRGCNKPATLAIIKAILN